MTTVNVDLANRSYTIEIASGLLRRHNLFSDTVGKRRVAVISNTTVAPLYLNQLLNSLGQSGIATESLVLPDSEQYKNQTTLETIYDFLFEKKFDRKSMLIALGGGVIGDLVGYAAATFMRGIPFIQIPTTLLAQVDSSVGGKTGINHARGKNLIGAFHQPAAVITDIETLNTLPKREYLAGLAEVIKYGLIGDTEFFDWYEHNLTGILNRDAQLLEHLIARCCQNKASIVSADETESGVRAYLNFGHTFGHAIELGLGYGHWLHGEAVAAGMCLAAIASERMGLINSTARAAVERVIAATGLPTEAPVLGVDRYIDLMSLDKKVERGEVKFILLKEIGEAVSMPVPSEILRAILK